MSGRQPLFLRQGDVLLIEVKQIPERAGRARTSGTVVHAEGETTGHAHVVRSRRASLHLLEELEERYLLVEGSRPVALTHEEHDPIAVPPGAWEVRRQREYR